MKKGKLQGEDGSEFTVFYHQDVTDAEPCSFLSPEKEEAKAIMKESLNEYLVANQGYIGASLDAFGPQEIIIDDSIDSDVVDIPIIGHLYRLKGLNIVAKLESHSLVEGVMSKRYYQMNYLGHEFHIPRDSLLKASEAQLAKEMDKYD